MSLLHSCADNDVRSSYIHDDIEVVGKKGSSQLKELMVLLICIAETLWIAETDGWKKNAHSFAQNLLARKTRIQNDCAYQYDNLLTGMKLFPSLVWEYCLSQTLDDGFLKAHYIF